VKNASASASACAKAPGSPWSSAARGHGDEGWPAP
jgi:hypothetical protein